MTTTAVPAPPDPALRSAEPTLRSTLTWVAHRWPSFVAVALITADWGMSPAEAAETLPLLPMFYVLNTAVLRRGATWPLLAAALAFFTLLTAQRFVDPLLVMTGVAVVAGVVAIRRGAGAEALLQLAAFAVIAVLVLVVPSVAPDVAAVMLAAGWAAHGLWDLWHVARRRIVAASFAEWCCVVDVLIAVALLTAL